MSLLVKDRKFYKTFFTMTGVIAMQNLITFAVNLADNIMIGGYSQDALSGVAMVNQIHIPAGYRPVLDAYDIPWCSWYGNFGPVLDKRDDAWYALWPWGWQSKRVGAEYKMVSDNWMIDTGLMKVYQKYMN